MELRRQLWLCGAVECGHVHPEALRPGAEGGWLGVADQCAGWMGG